MRRDDYFCRILVICTRQIGDVLLTTPLIRAAKRRWPDARIDVLGFAGTMGMLRGNPDVDALIEVQPGSGWWASMGLIRRLWRRYDLALVTQRSDRAHLYGWIAARVRSGLVPGTRQLGWWKRLLLDHALVNNSEEIHMVVEKLGLLDPWLRPEHRLATPLVVVPPAPRELPGALVVHLRSRYIVVHAPSMWRYKQWPVGHFRSLVRALLDDGWQVVLSGSAGEQDRACVAQVCEVASPPALIDASGMLDLGQLGVLLRGAALYIGPDTSVTHLAAACSVPVIALFGPTQPMTWGPWPQGREAGQPWQPRSDCQRAEAISLMQGPGDCVPCRRAGCEHHNASRADCLEALSPERVLQEARWRLAQAGNAPAVRAS